MERLTERHSTVTSSVSSPKLVKREFVTYKIGSLLGYEADEMKSEEIQEVLNKLADYEDLDERGMVIRDGEPQKCFAQITFDKDDLQELVDEKIAEIELDIDAVKEQTIDNFVKELSRYAFSNEYGTHIVFTPEQLDEMANHLKAGGK